jgi:hypothetical protein
MTPKHFTLDIFNVSCLVPSSFCTTLYNSEYVSSDNGDIMSSAVSSSTRL